MLNAHIVEAIRSTVDDYSGNVVILSDRPKGILDQLTNELAGTSKVFRANGQEGLEIDNGSWVEVIRLSEHGRGLTANLLIVPIGLSYEQREELVPVIATGGDLLGYL